MTRSAKARRWIHRPHPRRRPAVTSGTDYSTARLLMGGYGSRSS